jgi:hypothetical protein
MEARHNMKITERTHDIETGEIVEIERDETAAETKARLEQAKVVADRLAEETQKAADRAALLAQLGITEEQAKLLLG